MAQVAAVVQVQSLAWELPHLVGVAKKKKLFLLACPVLIGRSSLFFLATSVVHH